jgi:hypothetical protein
MTSFLNLWDEGIARARETGEQQELIQAVDCDCGATKLVVTAKTMHPSFMGGRIPPKYDPKRDLMTGHSHKGSTAREVGA